MMGSKAPKTLGGSPSSLWIYVEDADALFNRAVTAGGQVAAWTDGRDAGPVLGRSLWHRSTDPEGYTWTIATRKEDLTREELNQRQAAWMKSFASPQPAHH